MNAFHKGRCYDDNTRGGRNSAEFFFKKKWGWEDDMMTSVIKKTKEHRSCSSIPGVNAHSNSLRRVKKKRIFHSAEWTFQKKISQIGTITPRPGDHLILCVPMAKADFKKKKQSTTTHGFVAFLALSSSVKKKNSWTESASYVSPAFGTLCFSSKKRTLYALVLFSFTFLGGIMKSVSIQEIINWCLKKG